MNVGMGLDLEQCLAGRLAVHVEYADGLATGAVTADGHAGDVDVVPAEDGADVADEARHVSVRKEQHGAVHVRVESEWPDLDQSQKLVAEQRSAQSRLLLGRHL